MVSTLFFDLDGTLMVNPFGAVVFPAVSESIAVQVGLDPEAVMGAILAEHEARLAQPFTGAERALTMDWELIFGAVAAGFGANYEAGTAEQLVIENATPPYSATLDDAPQVLATLRNDPHQARKLIVATMGLSKYQFPVLRALGLYPLFDAYLTPDTTNFLKFDREFWGEYLNADSLCIHVGDRYDHDCYYPKQYGARIILRLPIEALAPYDPFERPQYLQQPEIAERVEGLFSPDPPCLPDAVILSLSELPAVLALLEAEHQTP